jgi:hypothetical protein
VTAARVGLLALVVGSMWPALAAAQDVEASLTSARAALDEGDLIGAGTAVDHALLSETLSPDQLLAVYELRALLAYADDRLGMLEESLLALAILGASAAPASFPPPLRARFLEICARAPSLVLEVELVTEVIGDRRTVRVVPVAHGDDGHLVRSLRARAGIDTAALRTVGPEEALAAGDPHRVVEVRWALEALGPGGVIVARRGSEDDPESERLAALPIDETFLHVALTTAGAVVVAGAIALTIAYFATDGFTAGRPTIIGPVGCVGAPCPSPLLSF